MTTVTAMDNVVVVIVDHHPHQHYDKRDAETGREGGKEGRGSRHLEPLVRFYKYNYRFFHYLLTI